MDRENKGRRALGAWILSSLLVAYFHEPWRAEAQAWLIARTSTSLGELFFRSATEGAGPLYYLWIWPWAKAFPAAFPEALFWLSWSGSALAVASVLFSSVFPFRVAVLVVFGYLLGYEYASVARLYGWGVFFLFAGIHFDWNNRKHLGALLLAASCLVHVSFVFAVIGWCVYLGLNRHSTRHYGWVAGAIVLLAFYLWPALGVSIAREWITAPHWFERLGSTICAFLTPSHWRMGILGIPILSVALLVLSRRGRTAFLIAAVPCVLLFLWRVDGVASGRHGGPLFVLWVTLAVLSQQWTRLFVRRSVYGLLGISAALGLVARVEDIFRPYSEGLAAATTIEALSRTEGKVPRLFAVDEDFGYVTAARLNQPLWSVDAPMGCPYFAGKCPDTLMHREKDVWSRLETTELCPQNISCFFLGDAGRAEPFALTKGHWEKVFLPTASLSDENVVVYRLSRAPAP